MGTWMGGGCLAAVTAGGVWFVLAGSAGHSHCGPCLGACAPTPAAEAEPPRLMRAAPAVRYDEPPLARFRPPPADVPMLLQAGFQEPAALPLFEVAPMPRPVVPPGGPRLAGPTDRF